MAICINVFFSVHGKNLFLPNFVISSIMTEAMIGFDLSYDMKLQNWLTIQVHIKSSILEQRRIAVIFILLITFNYPSVSLQRPLFTNTRGTGF